MIRQRCSNKAYSLAPNSDAENTTDWDSLQRLKELRGLNQKTGKRIQDTTEQMGTNTPGEQNLK